MSGSATDPAVPTIEDARRALADGMTDLAGKIASDILATAPANLDALEIKALVEAEAGDHVSAEQTLRSAIAIAPERRWPYADLTRLLLKLNRLADAETVARAALAADPDNADAHAMLGAIFAVREQWTEAAIRFERALSLAGPHPQLLAGLGRASMRRGKLNEAQRLLTSAVAADPTALEPLVYLAEVEERLGNFEQAMRRLDAADAIARRLGTDIDLQRSVLLQRMGEDERALALLEGKVDLSGAARLQRGRLRDGLGRYPQAWADWISAKTQIAAETGRRYLTEEVEAQAEALSKFAVANAAADFQGAPRRTDVPQPIFIIGVPRSGTTLVEQILASHRRIRAGGELPFGADLREYAVALAGGEAAFPRALAGIPDWPQQLRDFYLTRAESYELLSDGADFFTDKMPSNDFWLPLLRMAFPESPVVHVRRHPLDVLTSMMAHDMTHGFNCAYRLEDAARHLALVDDLLDKYGRGGAGPTHEIRYEALVADQACETERLMAAIGLPMEEGQLNFHNRADVSPTPSYAQVKQPLNDRSIGRWRNYEAQLAAVRSIISDTIARGGYAA